MRRIEKLALELVEKATHPEGDPGLGRAMRAAYEAGFHAAREMAAQRLQRLMDFLSPKDEDGDFIRPIQHAQYDLQMLGEDEVPDGA